MKRFANILLAVFLILAGLEQLKVSFPLMAVITGIVAIAAGVLFLLRKA